jgi:hypothetical protein
MRYFRLLTGPIPIADTPFLVARPPRSIARRDDSDRWRSRFRSFAPSFHLPLPLIPVADPPIPSACSPHFDRSHPHFRLAARYFRSLAPVIPTRDGDYWFTLGRFWLGRNSRFPVEARGTWDGRSCDSADSAGSASNVVAERTLVRRGLFRENHPHADASRVSL